MRTCRRGTCVNLTGDVSGKASWRRGHQHGVLKEEQELTTLRVNREKEYPGIEAAIGKRSEIGEEAWLLRRTANELIVAWGAKGRRESALVI